MVSFNILSCFTSPEADSSSAMGSEKTRRGRSAESSPLVDHEGSLPGCPFCVVSKAGGFAIADETSDYIAFNDR